MGPHRLPEACSKASCQRWPGCERGFPERKRCPKVTVNPQRISRLQEHGLTEYEARAYLALLELENSEASPIADLARVPRTKIYQALDGLESKKLLAVIPDRPKRYQVAPISSYIDSL